MSKYYEPSAYKSVGIQATARPARRAPKAVDSELFSGNNDPELVGNGHSWPPTVRTKKKGHEGKTCRNCGHHLFEVEGRPCAGKKKKA